MKLVRGISRVLVDSVRDARADGVGPLRAITFMCLMMTAHAVLNPRGFIEDMHNEADAEKR